MKKYILIAGVNGAGKSTLYQSLQSLQGIPRVNTDETLCGKSILNNIAKAKERGYFIELHYIGVEGMDIAKKRVVARVKQGGHGINEKDIERRYIDTFNNLKIVLPKCDLAAFYDNTIEFHRFAIYKNGKPIRISYNVPMWYERFVADMRQR